MLASRPTRVIACDESGFVGGSLFGEARVFTHASLLLGAREAELLLTDVRRRLGGTEGELKASRINRSWARPVAEWLLAPEGPLQDAVVVHVTDTRLFGLARLAQVASGLRPEGWWSAAEDPAAWVWALALSDRLDSCEPDRERSLLDAGRDLLWIRRHRRMDAPLETWFAAARAVDGDPVLAPLGTPRAEAAIRAYVADPPLCPLNEPLLPALWSAMQHWSDVADLEIVHDEQSVLTPARIRALADQLANRHPGRRLIHFRRVDSRDDARVQLADLVAGAVRRTWEDHLAGLDDRVPDLHHLLATDSVGFSGGARARVPARGPRAGRGRPRGPSPGPSATC